MSGARKLPLPSRIMAVQYRVFDRMRHPQAYEVAAREGSGRDFEAFRGVRQALVVTFRRDGTPVPTPVNFGLSEDGTLIFRSEPHVAKVKRLARDPHVRVCPCNVRGKPLADVVEATARILPEPEVPRAYEVVAANWSLPVRAIEVGYDRIGVPMAYIEVVPGAPLGELGQTPAEHSAGA